MVAVGEVAARAATTSVRAFGARTPDRVNLDEIALVVVKVIHVAASLRHEHPLNQLASGAAVALSDAGSRAYLPEDVLEFGEEELLRVTVLPPPSVFGLEPPLRLIE